MDQEVALIGGSQYSQSLLAHDYEVARSCLFFSLSSGMLSEGPLMIKGRTFHDVARIYLALDGGLTPLSVLWPTAPTKAHATRDAARKEMIEIFSPRISLSKVLFPAFGRPTRAMVPARLISTRISPWVDFV